MRFSEFKLSEATLQRTSTTSWPSYLGNLINSKDIGIGPQGEKASGLELDEKSKAMLSSLLKKIQKSGIDLETARSIEELVVTFTDGSQAPVKYIHKSAEIKGGANASGSEKKPWNEGEVAETILGAALYARFISKKEVTEKDVWAALRTFTNNVVPGGFEIAGTKRNKKSPIKMLALNKPMNNKVIDDLIHSRAELEKDFPNGVKGLEDKVKACASYVNESSKVNKALQKADENPGAPITIKTDGVGDQKGTKADLEIRIGEWEQLLSLKVNDVKQFGQESGSSGQVVSSFFSRFIPDLDLSDLYMDASGEPIPWNPQNGTGWPDMGNVKAVRQLKHDNLWDAALVQVYKLTGKAYQKAAAHLQQKLSTDEGAAEVISDLYNGIMYHAQGGAQFQTLVILNPTSKIAWKELEFGPSLAEALEHYQLSVTVEVGERGGSNHRLRILGTPLTPEAKVAAQMKIQSVADAKKAKKKADTGIVPAVGPEILFQLRSYQQESGNMRNPVEMGPLLKDLTEVQKIEDLPSDTTVDIANKQQQKQLSQQGITQPAEEPPIADAEQDIEPQAGIPSGMQSIEPAPAIQADPEGQDADELARVRKNAGLVVE